MIFNPVSMTEIDRTVVFSSKICKIEEEFERYGGIKWKK